MSQERSELVGEVRVRLPLPFIIPVGALAVIAALTFGFSRILLAIPKEAATIVAIVMALNVLGAMTVLALRPEMARATALELAAVVLWPVIVGIAIAVLNVGEGTAEENISKGAATATTGLSITAKGVSFDTSEITLPAKEEVSLHFVNGDPGGTPHNFSIYNNADATKDIFKGEVIDGGDDINYEFTAPPKGDYYFQCDVHPSMNGTVISK